MSDVSIPPHLREFHCIHCNGKIRIPRELPPTTGPCPHCQGIITSPASESAAPLSFGIPPIAAAPVAPATPAVAPIPGTLPSAPALAPAAAAIPPIAPVVPVAPTIPEPAPIPQSEPAPLYREPVAPPAPAPQYQEPVSLPQEPAVAPAPEPQPAPVPVEDREPVTQPPIPSKQERRRLDKKSSSPTKAAEDKSLVPVLLLSVALLAFAGAAGFFVYKEMKKRSEAPLATLPVPQNSEMAESQYIRSGWKKEAYTVLEKFVAAKTVEEKLPFVIQSPNLKANMDSFYGGSTINDLDTPADAFSVVDLTEADHKRGIFLMIFDQPPQFDIKDFFRPLAPLEVQYGIDEANLLLSTFAKVGNFATEPVRVNAFFKRTPQGLKLDWETFAQSKYRTFRNMIELPDPGQSAVFRIQISEDVPETGKPLPATLKTYRVFDPSSPEVSARINVNVDSEIGRTLSEINWMGAQNRPIIRTATLELQWTAGDQPELHISRFICWEFLHLGGQADPLAAPKH